jgi:predicted metalloprotease
MSDLNYFWQSGVTACACDVDSLASGCYRNAVVYGGPGYGYIFYDRNLLNSMDASGSTLPADFVMAHEFGHNIQIGLGLPSSGGKYKELQADCLGGYYVGFRIRRNLATQSDVVRTFSTACGLGDPTFSPWWVQGAHGTCTERAAALQAGIAGYLAGAKPGQACPSL